MEYKGRTLLAYRRGCLEAHVEIAELGADFQPRDIWRLDLCHPLAVEGREDPRLFAFRDRLHLSFDGIGHGGKRVTMLFARLSSDGRRVEDVWAPHWEGVQQCEKNWSPFEHDGQLYVVYSIEPHVVLRLDASHATEVARTSANLSWDYGHLRGGAPPVRVADEYYHFFHGHLKNSDGHYLYCGGVYTFAARPPFAVRRFARQPILLPSSLGVDKSIVFPCGAIRRGNKWFVSHGHQDNEVRIVALDAGAVERVLRPVDRIEHIVGSDPLPPAYCIHLARTHQRTEIVRQHFAERGLTVQWWEGLDGHELGLRTALFNEQGGHVGPGHVGLSLTHRALWQHCLTLSGNVFLILEDDAILCEAFPARLRELLGRLPCGWQFCYAGIIDEHDGWTERKITERCASGLVRLLEPHGTHCYLVTRAGLGVLLNRVRRVSDHIDQQLAVDALPYLDWYTAWPTLAAQRTYTGEWPTAAGEVLTP